MCYDLTPHLLTTADQKLIRCNKFWPCKSFSPLLGPPFTRVHGQHQALRSQFKAYGATESVSNPVHATLTSLLCATNLIHYCVADSRDLVQDSAKGVDGQERAACQNREAVRNWSCCRSRWSCIFCVVRIPSRGCFDTVIRVSIFSNYTRHNCHRHQDRPGFAVV